MIGTSAFPGTTLATQDKHHEAERGRKNSLQLNTGTQEYRSTGAAQSSTCCCGEETGLLPGNQEGAKSKGRGSPKYRLRLANRLTGEWGAFKIPWAMHKLCCHNNFLCLQKIPQDTFNHLKVSSRHVSICLQIRECSCLAM